MALYVAFCGDQYDCSGGFSDTHRVCATRDEAVDWCRAYTKERGYDWGEVSLLTTGASQAEVVWRYHRVTGEVS